jgi:hypothetical protein
MTVYLLRVTGIVMGDDDRHPHITTTHSEKDGKTFTIRLYSFVHSFAYSINKSACLCWTCWTMAVIPALGRLKHDDCKFKASLGYIARPCFKK